MLLFADRGIIRMFDERGHVYLLYQQMAVLFVWWPPSWHFKRSTSRWYTLGRCWLGFVSGDPTTTTHPLTVATNTHTHTHDVMRKPETRCRFIICSRGQWCSTNCSAGDVGKKPHTLLLSRKKERTKEKQNIMLALHLSMWETIAYVLFHKLECIYIMWTWLALEKYSCLFY